MRVEVFDRKERSLGQIDVPENGTVDDLKLAFEKLKPKYYPDRQRFTTNLPKTKAEKAIVLEPGKRLSEYDLSKGIYFKDLGPQIGWKTVFLVEYFGPILIHCLNFFLPSLFYPGMEIKPYTYTQKIAFACVVIHFLKREFETAFVHRFSNGTMPLFNIFKNSTHYWIISGIMISYFVYHPLFVETKSELVVNIAAVVFLLMELGNFWSHMTLRNLRKPGSRDRGNPRGGLFEFVSCANYTYELAAWLTFAYFTQTLTAYIFFIVSFGQIYLWAIKKHVALKKEFGNQPGYPRGRKALIPFLI